MVLEFYSIVIHDQLMWNTQMVNNRISFMSKWESERAWFMGDVFQVQLYENEISVKYLIFIYVKLVLNKALSRFIQI